jgi:aspartyl-tRNA(Asn)/glutamyl-tRNA(Gln) amidotransferase subunit A
MALDLVATRALIASRTLSATAALSACVAAAAEPKCASVYVPSAPPAASEEALRAAAAADAAQAPPPLAGLAVSVKDLFDVRGEVTLAGSRALAGRPAAEQDCAAVARLRAAGAALLGRTNMTEFAYSGVGINPHYGTPANPAAAALGLAAPRIPGGSTSGGAVSVAAGAAWAALGTDTGGSLRIPAALVGLVGFKPTARLVPAEGCVPLAPSLDSVGAITRSVRDAALLHAVLSGAPAGEVEAAAGAAAAGAAAAGAAAPRALASFRFGVPTTLVQDGVEAPVAAAFAAALAALRAAGASVQELALAPLGEVPAANLAGGISATEAWAWHRALLAAPETAALYDPRVARRIRLGEGRSAADYLDLLAARRAWQARMGAAMAGFDVMLSPTTPLAAPEAAPLVESDEAFFAANGRLLRNTSVVNLLDGCGISIPCHRAGELPVGLHMWAGPMADATVLAAAAAVEAVVNAARTA